MSRSRPGVAAPGARRSPAGGRSPLSQNDIGPKARSLRLLAEAGLPVPEARFLGADAFKEHFVKLDLEARGELERVPMASPQRVRLPRS